MNNSSAVRDMRGWATEIRQQFPILSRMVNKKPLVYLDNAATTQMPESVIDRLTAHYHSDNANVHRGIHTLSDASTSALEEARAKVCNFINARSTKEIIFTSGTTDSINIVARGFGAKNLKGASIIVSELEHHANYVPWQQLCAKRNGNFIVAPLNPRCDIDLEALECLLATNKVLITAVTHVSNVTGTVNPLTQICELAHSYGSLVLVDAAQSIRHEPVNVANIDCDFLCFSGHKMLGPTGIGVLYGKQKTLEKLAPTQFGGEMVDVVEQAQTTYVQLPLRLEAGTPNYVGAIGLGASIDFMESIGREKIAFYEKSLLSYAETRLSKVPRLTVLGKPLSRSGCISFSIDGVHPYDLAKMLDTQGIAIRSGSQCAQPLLRTIFKHRAVSRVSPAFYNTPEEVDFCVDSIAHTADLLRSYS